MRGWYNLPCWNGLTAAQQDRLIHWGNLPLGFLAAGRCTSGAAVAVEWEGDEAPGPRFYCLDCALARLTALK
jgi:hypothetical protein